MTTGTLSIPHDAWVVVADGEKALFLRNEGDGVHPYLQVFREEEIDNPPNREQAANRRGRQGDANSPHKSAYEDTDWKQLGKDRFAKDMADILYRGAHANKFDKLVIAADPSTLGNLRKELHKAVQEKVIAEIDKDLTNHDLDGIEQVLTQQEA